MNIKENLKEQIKEILEGFEVREESISRAVEEILRTPDYTPPLSQTQTDRLREINTPEQIADYLQVEPRTVRAWLRSGKLQGVKMGKEWRIRAVDLETFIKEGIRLAQNTTDHNNNREPMDEEPPQNTGEEGTDEI